MVAIKLLEKQWQSDISRFEIAPNGKEFIDITDFIDGFDVSRSRERVGQWNAYLSYWYASSNIKMTKQIFLHNGETEFEFHYKYFPAGKDAPYCMGKMLLPHCPIPDVFFEESLLNFRLAGNPVLGS